MPEDPRLHIHPRLESTELRARLDAYCARNRWSLTTAVNVLLAKALTADEAAQAADRSADA